MTIDLFESIRILKPTQGMIAIPCVAVDPDVTVVLDIDINSGDLMPNRKTKIHAILLKCRPCRKIVKIKPPRFEAGSADCHGGQLLLKCPECGTETVFEDEDYHFRRDDTHGKSIRHLETRV